MSGCAGGARKGGVIYTIDSLPGAAYSRARLGFVLGLLLLGALQACAINREGASVAPDRDLSSLKRLLVVRSAADERGTDRAIASALAKLGFDASTGPEGATP